MPKGLRGFQIVITKLNMENQNRKLIITEISDGYIEKPIEERAYIYGASPIPDVIVKEDGQWDDDLPEGEPQKKSFETWGCTVFDGNNQIEIQESGVYGRKNNHSDRAGYIMAKISPPGADPHDIYEMMRKKGLLDESDLPWSSEITNLKQYALPKPLPRELLNKAYIWVQNNFFKHEYLPVASGNLISNETMMSALKRSVLAVAVYAWAYDGEKYVRAGRDTHWTVVYGYKEGEYWKCFDSYAPFHKKLDWNFEFGRAKRIYIREKTEEEKLAEQEQLNLIAKILKAIGLVLKSIAESIGILKKEKEDKPEPVKPEPEPEKKSLLEDWGKAIEAYENTAKWRNNPGAIKGLDGKFLTFKTYREGFEYLLDYLNRAATNKHKAYNSEMDLYEFFSVYAPVEDRNNPTAYAEWVAKKLEVKVEIKIKELI